MATPICSALGAWTRPTSGSTLDALELSSLNRIPIRLATANGTRVNHHDSGIERAMLNIRLGAARGLRGDNKICGNNESETRKRAPYRSLLVSTRN